jgi:hypothetical protein
MPERAAMSVTPLGPLAQDRPDRSQDWIEAAQLASGSIGFEGPLHDLTPEHWQLVLVTVEDRMRLRGTPAPLGWQRRLARQDGRTAR